MRKLLGLSLLLLITFAGGGYYIRSQLLNPKLLEAEFRKALGRSFKGTVHFESITYDGWRTVAVKQLVLESSNGAETYLTAGSIEVAISVSPTILAGRIPLSSLKIDGADLSLKRMPGGDFTFQRSLTLGAWIAPEPRKVPAARQQDPWFPPEPSSLASSRPVVGNLKRPPFLANAAGTGSPASSPLSPAPVGENRSVDPGSWPLSIDEIRFSRCSLQYQDRSFLIDLDQIDGFLTVDRSLIGIRSLKGRLKESYPFKVEGSLDLQVPQSTRIKGRLDPVELDGLMACLPALSLPMGLNGETFGGTGNLSLGYESEPGSSRLVLAGSLHEASWISPKVLGIDLRSQDMTLEFTATSQEISATLKVTEAAIKPHGWGTPLTIRSGSFRFVNEPSSIKISSYSLQLESGTIEGSGFYRYAPTSDYEIEFTGSQVQLPQLGSAGIPALTALSTGTLDFKGRIAPGFFELSKIGYQEGDARVDLSLALDLSTGIPTSLGGTGTFTLPFERVMPAVLSNRLSGVIEGRFTIREDKSPFPPVDVELTGGPLTYLPVPGSGRPLVGQITGGVMTMTPSLIEVGDFNLVLGEGEVELSGIIPLGGGARQQGDLAVKAAGVDLSPLLPLVGMGGVFVNSRVGAQGRLLIDLDQEVPYDLSLDLSFSPLTVASRPELATMVGPEGLTFPMGVGKVRLSPLAMSLTDVSAHGDGVMLWGTVIVTEEFLQGQVQLRGSRIDPSSRAAPEAIREVTRSGEIIDVFLDLIGTIQAPEISVSERIGE